MASVSQNLFFGRYFFFNQKLSFSFSKKRHFTDFKIENREKFSRILFTSVLVCIRFETKIIIDVLEKNKQLKSNTSCFPVVVCIFLHQLKRRDRKEVSFYQIGKYYLR